MILPVYTYGAPILRAQTTEVMENTPALQQLIDDMIETMRGAAGIGIAAPQVGRTERLFVVDLTPMADKVEEEGGTLPPQPMVFINPEIIDEGGEACEFEEGCLSIPDIRELVDRPDAVRVRFQDRTLDEQEIEARGLLARVVQHEFDHLNGVLFIDHISPFRRRLLKRRLREMARGMVEAEYPLQAVSPE